MELLHSKQLTKDESLGKSAQEFVDIAEIKDGVVILKNNSLRAVLMVSSINFDLKATQEQEAIVAAYQGFLNSLDFPLQIIISTRKLDISPYIELLTEKEHVQTNDLLRFQISEYHGFIKNLVGTANIMAKTFYIVVPFALTEAKSGGFLEKLKIALNPKQAKIEREMEFENYKSQLWQRVDHITAGLSGTGIKIAPLGTEELVELFYNAYNPKVTESAEKIETEKLEINRI
jgi:type IV secretory pathway VirB4 component